MVHSVPVYYESDCQGPQDWSLTLDSAPTPQYQTGTFSCCHVLTRGLGTSMPLPVLVLV